MNKRVTRLGLAMSRAVDHADNKIHSRPNSENPCSSGRYATFLLTCITVLLVVAVGMLGTLAIRSGPGVVKIIDNVEITTDAIAKHSKGLDATLGRGLALADTVLVINITALGEARVALESIAAQLGEPSTQVAIDGVVRFFGEEAHQLGVAASRIVDAIGDISKVMNSIGAALRAPV